MESTNGGGRVGGGGSGMGGATNGTNGESHGVNGVENGRIMSQVRDREDRERLDKCWEKVIASLIEQNKRLAAHGSV
jgi:hypothetical protein